MLISTSLDHLLIKNSNMTCNQVFVTESITMVIQAHKKFLLRLFNFQKKDSKKFIIRPHRFQFMPEIVGLSI